ncbi:MAG: DUF4837 family protein [Bacteroidaceae bacterium]|nr:DUF4837 family protein [Bacteroidaceae bacterium]
MKAITSIFRLSPHFGGSWRGALLLSLLFFVSCQNNPMVKPSASGRPYEVLVVMDEEPWKGPTGQALVAVLTGDIAGLPQSESFASVSNVSVANFTNALKYFRNIIYVDIDGSIYSRVKMTFTRNENASGQYIITIHAPSQKAFIEWCEEKGDGIKALIHRGELNRMADQLKRKYSGKTYDMVKETFDCRLYVPVDLSCFKQGENFVWTSTPGNQMNICVYSYPYEGPQTFNKAYCLAKRDSIMGANIPGGREGSCMGTDTLSVDVTDIVVRGGYACEARGLWKMTKEFLGGPFVSHSRVDTINNRVIVAEGFVMEFDKLNRTMMRTLEAALYTLDLPAAAKEEKIENEEERTENKE